MINNYARKIATGKYVFFATDPPPEVAEQPALWAVWVPIPHMPRVHVIGESSDHYCRLNGHITKLCASCRFRPKPQPS